jgi:glycosyltransferase involved in cell wall biosynthesis
MRCSIIIPTRDRKQLLLRGLKAFTAQDHPAYEVIVVDDGSREPVEPSVRREFPTVRCLRQEPLGQVPARNLGLRAANGELLVFSDDDCRPPQRWLRLHESHYADPKVGAAGGPQVPIRPAFCDRFYMAQYRREFDESFRVDTIRGWERALTANLSMRRETVERLGGFDPRFLSGSDADQMRRIVRAGWIYVHDVALAVAHEKRLGPVAFLRERFRKASGSLVTDVKEGSLHLRRFIPLPDPRLALQVWRDYRAMFGSSPREAVAFWVLVVATRWVEVAGRAFFYFERGAADRGQLPRVSPPPR